MSEIAPSLSSSLLQTTASSSSHSSLSPRHHHIHTTPTTTSLDHLPPLPSGKVSRGGWRREGEKGGEGGGGVSYLHPGARALVERRDAARQMLSLSEIPVSPISLLGSPVSPISLDEAAAGDVKAKSGQGGVTDPGGDVGEGGGIGGDSGTLSGMAYSVLEPFLLANGYGLFRDMTGVGPSVLDSHGRVVAQVT
jgi:hypothetical protein